MTLFIAIPMKDLSNAKSRLAPILSDDDRARLAIAMLRSTIAAFAGRADCACVGVVTASECVADIALRGGAAVVWEQTGPSLNGAADLAAHWAAEGRATSLLLIHADIPVLHGDEIEAMIRAGRDAQVVIATAKDGGTNALLVRPPKALAFSFGGGSATAHARAAEAAGLSFLSLSFEHLSQDLDTPDDLLDLIKRDGKGWPARLLLRTCSFRPRVATARGSRCRKDADESFYADGNPHAPSPRHPRTAFGMA